jgi:hypothetical protein
MARFFDTIGFALLETLRAKQCLGHPPHKLVAHIESWAAPRPTFDVWPCEINPTGAWNLALGLHHLNVDKEEDVDVAIALNHVDVHASNVSPASRPEIFPQTCISSNFAVFERFWAEGMPRQRAAGLYLPEPGLAHVWPRLVVLPEVAVDAMYTLTLRGAAFTTSLTVGVTLVCRFSETARVCYWRNLNEHLLTPDAPPPLAWSTTYPQFGQPITSVRKPKLAKQPRMRTTRRDAPYLSPPGDDTAHELIPPH